MLFFIKANIWLTAIACMGFVSCANKEDMMKTHQQL